jgi:hypothetical protein
MGSLFDTLIFILYGSIGFFGAAALFLIGVGYVVYFLLMGLESRAQGVRMMEWAVAIMFVVSILAFILRLLQ